MTDLLLWAFTVLIGLVSAATGFFVRLTRQQLDGHDDRLREIEVKRNLESDVRDHEGRIRLLEQERAADHENLKTLFKTLDEVRMELKAMNDKFDAVIASSRAS